RTRIAEISVPAWPMPIHHTVLTIMKPQAAGISRPMVPMPSISSQPIENRNTHQKYLGMRPRSGTLEMRPTISLSEGWPAITRSVTAALRVVAHLAEVSGARARAELGEHGVVGRLGLFGHDLGGLVVDIAEGDGARRAGLLAGGLD